MNLNNSHYCRFLYKNIILFTFLSFVSPFLTASQIKLLTEKEILLQKDYYEQNNKLIVSSEIINNDYLQKKELQEYWYNKNKSKIKKYDISVLLSVKSLYHSGHNLSADEGLPASLGFEFIVE